MVAESRKPFLIAAALVSAVALTGLLGLPVEIAGVLVALIALLVTAQDARSGAGVGSVNWWNLILGGLVLWIVGIPVGLLIDSLGGILETSGAALCLVGSLFGLP